LHIRQENEEMKMEDGRSAASVHDHDQFSGRALVVEREKRMEGKGRKGRLSSNRTDWPIPMSNRIFMSTLYPHNQLEGRKGTKKECEEIKRRKNNKVE